MKRILILLMVFTLIFMGCAPQEQQKEEEIEPVEQEDILIVTNELEEDQNEAGQQEQEDTTITLNGKLIAGPPELSHGIMLHEFIEINDQRVKEIYFKNKDNLLKFLPRENLTYYFEGGEYLKENLRGELDIVVLMNTDSFSYEEEREIGFGEIDTVMLIGSDKVPVDRSLAPYPDQYYQDIINNFHQASGTFELGKNIKEHPFYSESNIFKVAVDNLISKGYIMTLGEDADGYSEYKFSKEPEKTEFILEGALLSNLPPHGTGIKLNNPLEIKKTTTEDLGSFTFNHLYFPGDEIYDYVAREHFEYKEPFIELKEAANIPVKIKVDLEFFMTEYVGHDILRTEDYEILEVNNTSNLVDYSEEKYPFENVYHMSDISKGDEIEGFTVSEIIYNKNNNFSLSLNGPKKLKGTLSGGINEMDGEIEYYFQSDNKFTKPIEFKFEDKEGHSSFTGTIDQVSGVYSSDNSFSNQSKNYLLAGNELKVEATVSEFFQSALFQSEGYNMVETSNLDILEDSNYENFIESEKGKMVPGLESESFSLDGVEKYINYSDYESVILPMRDTRNQRLLSSNRIEFEGDNLVPLKFTVFGEVTDVKINYIPNMGEEGQWKSFDSLSNITLHISAPLPNDMSTVRVMGKNYKGEDFEFTLDDMRDTTSYDWIATY